MRLIYMANTNQSPMMSALMDIRAGVKEVSSQITNITSSVMSPVEGYALDSVEKCQLVIREAIDALGSAEETDENEEEHDAISTCDALTSEVKAVIARVIAEAMHPKAKADKQVLIEEVKFYSETLRDCSLKDVLDSVKAAEDLETQRDSDVDKGVVGLKIIGYGGRDEVAVNKQWIEQRKEAFKNHALMRRGEQMYEANMKESSYSVVESARGKSLATQNKALQLSADHLKKKQYAIVFDGDGQTVSDAKAEMPAIPLPAGMNPPRTEDRKIVCTRLLEWTTQPAVVKRFYLIIPDFKYIIEVVNPQEATHVMPPDRRDTWIEEEPAWMLSEGMVFEEVKKDFEEAKKKQWTAFYNAVVASTECPEMVTWINTLHTVGQHKQVVVNFAAEAREDGAKLLWNMLSDLVNFNTDQQQKAVTTLNALASKWDNTSVTKSIAVVRSEVDMAAEMGVIPSYELCMKPLLFAIQRNPENSLFQSLRDKNLTNDTIRDNDRFNQGDCSLVLNDVLAVVAAVMRESSTLEDRQEGGQHKRKKPLSAMGAGMQPEGKSKSTVESRVFHVVQEKFKTTENKSKKEEVQAFVVNMVDEDAKMPEISNVVEACLLTLTSGKTLTEHAVRKEADRMRNDKGSDAKGGKKGAKKGKGKGGDAQSNKGGRGSGTQKRARDHGSRQDSGGQNGPECKSSECTNKVKWNHASNNWFQDCYYCAKQTKKPRHAANSAGVDQEVEVFKFTSPNGDSHDLPVDANTARVLALVDGGASISKSVVGQTITSQMEESRFWGGSK